MGEDITYQEFIQNIINKRGQSGLRGEKYVEKHHIVPRCMGGEGDCQNGKFIKESTHPNCIYLTYTEHIEAHRLLSLENPNNKKLVCAWWKMIITRAGKCIISDNERELAKRAFIDAQSSTTPWNKGVATPIETRQKQSEARKRNISQGKYIGGDHPMAKEVICLETGQVFPTVSDAAKHINVGVGTLVACLKGAQKSSGGLHWMYKIDFDSKNTTEIEEYLKSKKHIDRRIKVYCIERGRAYPSIQNALKDNGMHLRNGSHIKECCDGERQTAGGYHWRYATEDDIK